MNFALTTATFYKSLEETRFELALQFLEEARRESLPVVLVDGSPDDFASTARSAFTARGAIVLPELQKGMGQSRRQAWRKGFEVADIINWCEPEKPSYVKHARRLMERIASGECDAIVPGRDPKSFATYPSFQQLCETIGNRIAGILTDFPADVWYGPKVFNRKAGQHFIDAEDLMLWDSIIVPVYRALAAGYKVISVELTDVGYPPAQAREEEGDEAIDLKRWMQLKTLIATIGEEARGSKLVEGGFYGYDPGR